MGRSNVTILDQHVTRRARLELLNRARALRTAQFGEAVSRDFTLNEIRGSQFKETLLAWFPKAHWPNGQAVIYSINAVDVETARRIVNALPDREGLGYNLPRRPNGQPAGPTLYVGSSENIRSRLFQHLCLAPNGTYALNLSRWCPEACGPITVRVQGMVGEPDRQLTQDVEDALWSSLRPALGKKGGR